MCYYLYVRRLSFVICAVVFLSACGHKRVQVSTPQPPSPSTATAASAATAPTEATPSADLEGLASYYAEPYHGRRTASGEIFDTYQGLTAAHRTLPFNTMVRVTNKANGRQVDVRINDRGPFVDGRVIDLSLRAAREIDLVRAGTAPVRLKILKLEASARALATSAASADSSFAVQVGAFESQRAAEDLKQRLEKKYPGVAVQTFVGEKTIYRVRVGHEPNLAAAEKLAAELKKEDLEPFVVRGD